MFHLYVLRSEYRQALLDHLKTLGILAGVHYPVPVHLQLAYQGRIRTATDMSVTEALANEVISLPIYPELRQEQVKAIATELQIYIENSSKKRMSQT